MAIYCCLNDGLGNCGGDCVYYPELETCDNFYLECSPAPATTEPPVSTTTEAPDTTEPPVNTTTEAPATTTEAPDTTEPPVSTTTEAPDTTEPPVNTTTEAPDTTEPPVSTTTEALVETTTVAVESPPVFTSHKILGQVAPTAKTNTDIYTVPIGADAVSSTLTVCNRGISPTTYRVAIRPLGASLANNHYISFDQVVQGNDSVFLTLGIAMSETDVVTVFSNTTDLSFTLFGVEIT
jgi:hypothetical protein